MGTPGGGQPSYFQGRQIQDLEKQLRGADYPLEAPLAHLNLLGDRLSEGTTKQRKQALSLMFSRISVSLTGEITEVEPQPWVQPLFVDLVALSGDNKCPLGIFEPWDHDHFDRQGSYEGTVRVLCGSKCTCNASRQSQIPAYP